MGSRYFANIAIGDTLALVAMFTRHVSTILLIISLTEHIWFKCLMVYQFKTTAVIGEEFFARFCKLFNVLAALILSSVQLQLGNLRYQHAFTLFSEGLSAALESKAKPGR